MDIPQTRYATRPDGVSIAYQVVGEGPLDLLLAPGFVSHLDLQWTDPGFSHMLRRLASFARLIVYDKPGTGVSDPIPHVPALEERMADIRHVLDAAGSTSAALLGVSEGGPAAMLFAATYPERTRALVLYGTFSHVDTQLDGGRSFEQLQGVLANWGDGDRLADLFMPSAGAAQRRFAGVFARAAASPAMARAVVDTVFRIDARGVLGAIACPTLVVHRSGERAIPVTAARETAAGIPGARLVELAGIDHIPWVGDADAILDEVETFLTGARHAREPERMLATVLFTDICGSTERAAAMGDAAWRALLERHDALARERVESFGGRVVKSLGDGMLASFDGPARAVRCAQGLCEEVAELGIEVRAGVHTGEIEIVGDDVAGLAVHLGARVGALAGPGEVLVSSTVKDLTVGSDLHFADAGEHELKGVPGTWRLYRLGDGAAAAGRRPLEPARDHMRLGDKLAVGMARRAPRAMRAMARLAQS